MKIFALSEGSYSVDASKKFIPFDPQKDNYRDRPGSLFIHVNPFLIQTATDLIVLDAGLGYNFFMSRTSMFTLAVGYERALVKIGANGVRIKESGLTYELGFRTAIGIKRN